MVAAQYTPNRFTKCAKTWFSEVTDNVILYLERQGNKWKR